MTWWDCVWLDEECLMCQYWHRMVQQKEQPECPRGLNPNWRMIMADKPVYAEGVKRD